MPAVVGDYLDGWPVLHDDARIGLVDDLWRLVEHETEADPVGIVVSFLAAYGNLVGVGPKMRVGATIHRPVLNVIKVGATSKARKGTGQDIVDEIMRTADSTWDDRVVSGHQSGEAFINDLTPGDDGALPDKRLFVVEGEFSRLLNTKGRQGNVLSDTIRTMWDGKPLHRRLASGAQTARDYVVSIVADITGAELGVLFSEVDVLSGLGNRFLWVRVRRNGTLPDGGNLKPSDFDVIAKKVNEASIAAAGVETMSRDVAAEERWSDWYIANSHQEKHGLYDAITGRDEAQVLRLSMIYALLEGTSTIERRHIDAAIAVWDYCDESARGLFGNRTGNKDVDKLAEMLHTVGTTGLDGRALNKVFFGNSVRAARARDEAIRLGIAVEETDKTGRGRPRKILYADHHRKGSTW
jgi:hypothetical protein